MNVHLSDASSEQRTEQEGAAVDLEMTRLCAQAMDIPVREEVNHPSAAPSWSQLALCSPIGDGGPDTTWYYDPLHDDAQAMALVKAFDIVIERDGPGRDRTLFGVTLFPPRRRNGTTRAICTVRHAESLNRAIVECVAKLQLDREVEKAPELG